MYKKNVALLFCLGFPELPGEPDRSVNDSTTISTQLTISSQRLPSGAFLPLDRSQTSTNLFGGESKQEATSQAKTDKAVVLFRYDIPLIVSFVLIFAIASGCLLYVVRAMTSKRGQRGKVCARFWLSPKVLCQRSSNTKILIGRKTTKVACFANMYSRG